MKTRRFALLLLIAPWVVIILSSSSTAGAVLLNQRISAHPTNSTPAPTTQMIVKFKDSAGATRSKLSQGGALLTHLNHITGVDLQYVREMSGNAYVLAFPEQYPWAVAERITGAIATLPNVEYAHPNQRLGIIEPLNARDSWSAGSELLPSSAPNDDLYAEQWHYRYTPNTHEGIHLEGAWSITTGSASIVVAVLDSGETAHPDLAGSRVDGYDLITDPANSGDGDGRDSNPSDPGTPCGTGGVWHGTHVAGTISAATNNDLGVAGVSWGAKFQSVRVIGCDGATADIADGIRWAAGLQVGGVPMNATPAKVINMSIGGLGPCPAAIQDAINDAVDAGAIVVGAAGNDYADASGIFPANCTNVITVAATTQTGDKALYSNDGRLIDVAAPGDEVLSTSNTGTGLPIEAAYARLTGTSMAAPHVAGVAALIATLQPSYTHTQTLALLRATARPFPSGSACSISTCGAGIVDATRALTLLTSQRDQTSYLPLLETAAPRLK